MEEPGAPSVAPSDDVGLLCQVIASATSERVLHQLAEAGFDDVRVSHGYIFQGLLAGDSTVTQLAQRLGVTAQAVSKAVTELEALGYLERQRDERDGRARAVVLTPRATAMLAVSRQARRAVSDEVVAQLGERDTRELVTLLRAVSDRYGGTEAIASRRVRPVHGLE